MHNLEESDPILHSISREELSEYYRVILEKMPYLDNEFVMNELTYYLK